MFYNVVIDDWGGTTYVPTTLGNVLLIIIITALLIGAILFAKHYAAKQNTETGDAAKKGGKLTVKQLAFCAMSLALGTLLSEIKIIDFPWGGSATLLSMLVICLPGYLFGLGAGLMTGVAYGVLQILIDPYILFPLQLVVDYLLAFGALGLSGLFANSKNGLLKGYLVGILGRYVCLGRLGAASLLFSLQRHLHLCRSGNYFRTSCHSRRAKRHRRCEKDGIVLIPLCLQAAARLIELSPLFSFLAFD